MSLEDRCAYWVDLGITSYEDTYQLQRKLVEMRSQGLVPDTILATQHFDQVNFGTSKEHNRFSDKFLLQVNKEYGNLSDENIFATLQKMNVGFSQSDRGGGACVFSPGQFVYYPIVDHTKITGKNLDIGVYKEKIYRTIFETLSGLGVQGVRLTNDQSYATRKDRKDVWIERDGKTLKMGSKGLRISGNVAYHGFALYIDKNGTQKMGLVKPCGYDPQEVQVISVEEELGRKMEPGQVHNLVKKSLAKNFAYSQITEIQFPTLNQYLDKMVAA